MNEIYAIAVDSNGTLVASASLDKHVHLWSSDVHGPAWSLKASDRRTISIFQHSAPTTCVTLFIDSNYLLSLGLDEVISENG